MTESPPSFLNRLSWRDIPLSTQIIVEAAMALSLSVRWGAVACLLAVAVLAAHAASLEGE